MRTNIIINDALMMEAQKISGLKTKKDTVEQALKLFIRMKSQSEIRNFRGKLNWEGNLDQMRTDL